MTRSRIAAIVRPIGALCAAAALGCVAVEEPLDQLEGIVDVAISDIPGRPFGIRVAANGVIFVTRQDDDRVSRIPAGGIGVRDSADVGTDPGDVVVTSNGATAIVSTFVDGGLHFLDAATGDETGFMTIGSNAYRLMLSSSSATVFVTTTGGKVYAVSVSTGEKTDSVQLAGSLQGIARRNDGRIATSSSDGVITLLDESTLDVVADEALATTAQDIVFSSDGARLFVASELPSRVLVLDGQTLAPIDTITFPGPVATAPFSLALSPDGTTLLVGSAEHGSLSIVDAASHEVRTTFSVGGTPRRIAFSPNGLRAYIANEAGRVDVIR